MAEDGDSVRPEQQESQDSPRKIVAEIVDGGYCRILLTPEEHVRCTTDREFLNKILLQASIENASPPSANDEVDEKKVDISSGNAEQGKWSDEKIKLLLTLVSELTPHAKDSIERKSAWEVISQHLKEHGYSETYFGVSKKWANLKDRYKIILERLTKDGGGGEKSSWPYFETMDKILGWRNKMPLNEDIKSLIEMSFSSTQQLRIPITVDSDSEGTKEKHKERKGTKRKYGQIAGRSQKRYQRRKNNTTDHTTSAPSWLTTYVEERNEEEERWLEEFANNMSERNEAIFSLAATIAEFTK